MHVSGVVRVKDYVSPFRLCVALLAVSAFAGDAKLGSLLKAAEDRYNHATSLQVLFQEEYRPVGHGKRTESGTLLLRKPGRMRWDYDTPKGKLLISDGKTIWLYTPADNRAAKRPLADDTGEMQTPLAFLLGKLHFEKEFKDIKGRPEGTAMRITATPKTDDLLYTAVEFVITADARITEVTATGLDQTVYHYTFEQERLNPPLDVKLFHFDPPRGVEIVGAGN